MNISFLKDLLFQQKIIYQELTQGACFCLDEKGKFTVSNAAYMISGERLKYLIKLLNSKIVEFAFSHYYATLLGNNGIRWLSQNIENLPIPKPTKEQENAIIRTKSENEIESVVATLYNLTAEEVAFIFQ